MTTINISYASQLNKGVKVEFEYSGKTRQGLVEAVTEKVLTLELAGDDAKETKYKSFSKNKIASITIIG